MDFEDFSFGLYEKALPDDLDWKTRLKTAGEAGYDFVEISIDETDERLARLDWDMNARNNLVRYQLETAVRILSMCLSAHRRFPIGSADPEIRNNGMNIMFKAIDFAADTGIRLIQLAGYDCGVNEPRTADTRRLFQKNLYKSVRYASVRGVVLALENIGPALVDSVTRAMEYVNDLKSPYLQVYPDFGNLDAVNLNIETELQAGMGHMVGIHVKDTRKDVIRRIPFGEGRVDFEKTFGIIRDIGYRGPFLIEMWADDRPDAVAEIQGARLWILAKMKAVWGRSGAI
jgi:L-ribulose-5-phosphate 3-epimerase